MSSEAGGIRIWLSRPFHHLLIAAWPILFLLSNNLNEVDPAEAIVPVMVAIAVAAAGYGLLRLARLPAARAALLVTIAAIATLLYGHAASQLASLGLSGTPVLVGWLALWVLAAVAAVVVKADLSRLTETLNAVSAVLVLAALGSIGWSVVSQPRDYVGGQQVDSPVPSSSAPAGLPDIYYLIVEDHGAPRALQQYLDVPPGDFYQWLADAGFRVLPETRSNYGRTPLSLASQLNITYLDQLAAAMGPDESDARPIDRMVRRSEVVRFLKARGYQYVLVGSQYYLTATSPEADVNPQYYLTSDFLGVLGDYSILPAFTEALGFQDDLSARRRKYDAALWGLETIRQVSQLPGPKFVFFHLWLPHDPWIVDDQGRYVTGAADAKRTPKEQYRTQWSFVHGQMRSLIQDLLTRAGERKPIIVLTTDEGPSPVDMPMIEGDINWRNATDAQLDQKFSIFAAYYLPGVDASCIYEHMSSVNTFRAILDLYFAADLPLLPDRSFSHANRTRPYALTDITERLPAAFRGSEVETRCD